MAGGNIHNFDTFFLAGEVSYIEILLNSKKMSAFSIFKEQTHLRFLIYSINEVIC